MSPTPAFYGSLERAANPQTVLDFLRRNRALIVGVSVFVTFWMLVYTFVAYKPSYGAHAVVIIKDSAITDRYVETNQYYAQQTTSSSSSNPVLNTMGILKSEGIGDALWNFFSEKHPEELKKNKIRTRQDWNRFFQDGSSFIKAKNQTGTDLISVEFSWGDPVIAKEGLGVVIKAFQEASRDLNQSEQTTRTLFLEKQAKEIEEQLADIRTRKSEYQSERHTVSVRREGDDLAGTRMELTNKLSQLEAQARGKENLVSRYQQLLGLSPQQALSATSLGQNSSMARLQDELYRLQQQYSLLNSSLTETNPKVQEVLAQIEQVKANIEAEKSRTMGQKASESGGLVVADSTRGTLISAMLAANGEAQDLRAQANVIRTRLNEINRTITNFPELAQGLASIEQKEASLSSALDHLRQKVLEGKIKQDQTLSNVFVVDAPRLPEKAQFPNRVHLIVLSVLMGLGAGLASAVVREQLFSSHEMPDWLQPIDAPVADGPVAPVQAPQATPIPVQQPEVARQPESASTQAVTLPTVSQLLQEPTAEKIDLPVTGSLFDSLVPVAGPMRRQPVQTGESLRTDLIGPLTAPVNQANVLHPVEKADEAVNVAESNSSYSDADLLPPVQETVNAPSEQTPSPRVKVASTLSLAQQAQARQQEVTQAAESKPEQIGVPVLHAAPSASPNLLNAQDEEHFLTAFDAEPVAELPTRSVLKDGMTSTISTETNQTVDAEADPARQLYEAKAKTMALPRRKRGIPAFLLDGAESEPVEPQQPYQLIPKKQLLAAGDDLMQDVAPLEPVSVASAEWPNEPQGLDDLSNQVVNATNPVSAFPEGIEFPSPDFKPRKPLMGSLWLGKKPSRNPEAYFGMGSRSRKQAELPTSLNRLMQGLRQETANFRG